MTSTLPIALRPPARPNPTRPFSLAQVAAIASVTVLLLSGCANRAEREALRQCRFTPRSTRVVANTGDSTVLALGLEISNPGPSAAILDSFLAVVSSSKPLARLSHGQARRIAPATTDTVELRLAMANQDVLATAFSFLLSPPDSLGIEGAAWIPMGFGLWNSKKHLKTKLPYQQLAKQLNAVFQTISNPTRPAPSESR